MDNFLITTTIGTGKTSYTDTASAYSFYIYNAVSELVKYKRLPRKLKKHWFKKHYFRYNYMLAKQGLMKSSL